MTLSLASFIDAIDLVNTAGSLEGKIEALYTAVARGYTINNYAAEDLAAATGIDVNAAIDIVQDDVSLVYLVARELNGERVVEYMPTYLRASHEAAGNSGSYPANGAIRVLVGANEQIDEDEWTSVVRPATVADLTRYADATESDYNDGMSA